MEGVDLSMLAMDELRQKAEGLIDNDVGWEGHGDTLAECGRIIKMLLERLALFQRTAQEYGNVIQQMQTWQEKCAAERDEANDLLKYNQGMLEITDRERKALLETVESLESDLDQAVRERDKWKLTAELLARDLEETDDALAASQETQPRPPADATPFDRPRMQAIGKRDVGETPDD